MAGEISSMSDFIVPKGGLETAPEVPQPNIFPMEWRVETPKLNEIYERAKREGYNPSMLAWDTFDPKDFSAEDRKSTRLNSSHPSISYAVFCLKKKKKQKT